MVFVSDFNIQRLLNAEFTAFALNFQRAVTESGATQMGVEPLLVTNFNSSLQSLVDQVYVTSGSARTAEMKQYDTRRVQIFRRIYLRLQMVECALDNQALSACKETVETHLLNRYPISVTKLPIQQKTAIMSGFLHDLSTKLTEDDIDALQIDEDIAALTQANSDFMTAYNARTTERAENANGLTVRLRSELYDQYRNICFAVQSMANSTLADNATMSAACQSFIGVLNVLLADAKKRYLQRIGKVSEDEEESPAETPADQPADENPTPGSDDNPSPGATVGPGGAEVEDDVVFPGA